MRAPQRSGFRAQRQQAFFQRLAVRRGRGFERNGLAFGVLAWHIGMLGQNAARVNFFRSCSVSPNRGSTRRWGFRRIGPLLIPLDARPIQVYTYVCYGSPGGRAMTKNRGATAPRVRVNVFLDAEQYATLTKLAETTRVPWAAYIREGVDMVLTKYKRKGAGK